LCGFFDSNNEEAVFAGCQQGVIDQSKTHQAHLLAAEDGAGDAPTFFATVLAALAVAVAPCSMPLAAAFAPRSTPLAAA